VFLAALAYAVWQDRIAREPGRAPVAVAPSQQDDFERYHDRSFRVVHVVDGDTLDIDALDGDKPRTRIRLWGVDTPEVARAGKPDMHFGPEASRFAGETLEGRKVHVVLSPLNTRDRYNRLLAYIFLERGGVMFNELLIEQGYAYADPRFDHHYRDQFRATEQRARRAGVGLWGNVTPDDMPPWKQRFEARTQRIHNEKTANMAVEP
jgi:endonuclease YncB( thermonuclease family)